MTNDLEKRLADLEAELNELKRLKEEQAVPPTVPPITIDSVRARIVKLRADSQDAQFSQYLTQLMNDLDIHRATPVQVSVEIDRVLKIYLDRIKLPHQDSYHDLKPINPRQDSYHDPNNQPLKKKTGKADGKPEGAEYTIGATVIGIVGSLFLLTGFITFGLNYLDGLFQGIFLYLVSAIIIIVSELYVKKKLAKFSHGLTGLGIAALYASTIINYLYMKIIGSIVAALITLLIAGFSVLISRKKDSAMMRMISFIGCYICFLSVLRFQNQLEFLVAIGVLFLVNITSVFFPNQKFNDIINNVHMALNTVFILIFAVLAREDGIMDIYIILCLVLNIVLLNIVCLRQKKNILTTVLFGIEAGAISIMILNVLNDLAHPYQLMSQRIYYLVLVFVLILAVSVFFYILSRDKLGKAYQYYFFIIFSLLMLVEPIGDEYIWGMLILFIVVKIFSLVKEYEAANSIITVFALGAGLACHRQWQTWLFFIFALASIPLIKRWRLFYQYTISIYLVIFAGLMVPAAERLLLPTAALVLFALIPVFHYLVRIASIKTDNESHEIASAKEGHHEKDRLLQMIYNLTNLGMIGFLSFLCIFSNYAWAGSLVALIGAISIILYLNPRFTIEFNKKYLLLAGYLTFMTLIVRFPNPIFTSMILMLIAVICVGVGFKIRDKIQRICGLILAIFVCIKIALYDLGELESLQKTIVFMVVGTFALLISLIYIRLERAKTENENKKESVENLTGGVYTDGVVKDLNEILPENEQKD